MRGVGRVDARRDPELMDRRPEPGLADTLPEVRARIESRLALLRFHPDAESHIAILHQETCRACPGKWCNYFCPSAVYEYNLDGGENRVAYEQCVECGTCRIGCPYRNIDWRPPRGGFGVEHRYGGRDALASDRSPVEAGAVRPGCGVILPWDGMESAGEEGARCGAVRADGRRR